MEKKSIISEIIQEREDVYNELTKALLDNLTASLDSIKLLFDDILCDFNWYDVSYDAENDVIVISGSARYTKPILKIQTPNGEIEVPTINEKGEPLLKDVHTGIPFEMAVRGSVKEIYTFLLEMETRKDSDIFKALNSTNEEIPLNSNDSIFDEMYKEMEKNKTRILH